MQFVSHISKVWIRRYIDFIKKGFLSGILFEVNPRVDIIFVSYFMNDAAVGIYSFAAYFVEGMSALINVIRNQVNPMLVRNIKQNNWEAIEVLVSTTRIYLYPIAILCLTVVLIFYKPIISLIMGEHSPFLQSYIPLAFLLSGVTLVSPFLSFDALLLQGGQVGKYIFMMLSILMTNCILQCLLLPNFGILGAAIGSALSYVAGAFYLSLMSRIYLDFNFFHFSLKERSQTQLSSSI